MRVMEQETRLELTTASLATKGSTTELLLLSIFLVTFGNGVLESACRALATRRHVISIAARTVV